MVASDARPRQERVGATDEAAAEQEEQEEQESPVGSVPPRREAPAPAPAPAQSRKQSGWSKRADGTWGPG